MFALPGTILFLIKCPAHGERHSVQTLPIVPPRGRVMTTNCNRLDRMETLILARALCPFKVSTVTNIVLAILFQSAAHPRNTETLHHASLLVDNIFILPPMRPSAHHLWDVANLENHAQQIHLR